MSKIHEGRILRILTILYKGNASDLADNLDITLNRLNYLYKMETLPDHEKQKILAHGNESTRWHTKEVEALLLFNFLDETRKFSRKKNSENVISGNENIIGSKNKISKESSNQKDKKEIKDLRGKIRNQQIEINKLKLENKGLAGNNKSLNKSILKLSSIIERLQLQFIKNIDAKDKDKD